MRKTLLIAALGLPLVFAGDPPKAPPAKPVRQYSPEKLAQIRQALTAQIAVRDDAENAMRTPTAGEAAVLNGPGAADTATPVTVPTGGSAIRGTQAGLEFSVARIEPDGKVSISHGNTRQSARPEASHAKK